VVLITRLAFPRNHSKTLSTRFSKFSRYISSSIPSSPHSRTSFPSRTHPRILHPSPFLLSLPTPPNPSLTTSQRLVQATISLISSAVKTNPAPPLFVDGLPNPIPIPFPLFPNPNADPKDVAELAVAGGEVAGEWGGDDTRGLATPAGVTTRFRTNAFSTSISGRGNGILSSETTLG